MFAWLSSVLFSLENVAPYIAATQIALVSLGLLPTATYLLFRQLAPIPIALTGAIIVLYLPTFTDMIGMFTDYGLSGLLHILTLSTGLFAIRTGQAKAYLLFGIMLSCLTGSTPKAISTAIVAIPIALIAMPKHTVVRFLYSAIAFIAPLMAIWFIYARIDPERIPLERNILLVEQNRAQTIRNVAIDVSDYGYPSGTPYEDIGYWRLGDSQSLTHIGDTIKFLLQQPPKTPGLSARLSYFLDKSTLKCMFDRIGVSWHVWLPLVFLGFLPVRSNNWLRHVLSIIFVASITVGTFVGITRVPHFTNRYIFMILVTLPGFALIGATAPARFLMPQNLRDWGVPWWPASIPILLSICISERNYPLMPLELRAVKTGKHPLSRTLRIRDILRPGDVVVDASPHGVATALFSDIAEIQTITYPKSGIPKLYIPGHATPMNRYIVLYCSSAENPEFWWPYVLGSMDRNDRFERVSHCIYRDTTPYLSWSFPE